MQHNEYPLVAIYLEQFGVLIRPHSSSEGNRVPSRLHRTTPLSLAHSQTPHDANLTAAQYTNPANLTDAATLLKAFLL
jgi:hypothetical protein